MIDKDRKQFAECISGLAIVFGKTPDAVFIKAFWAFLYDLDIDDIKRACAKAASTLKFMPTVSELRELAGVVSARQRAIMAWNAVSDAAGSVGSYRSVCFEDPIANAAVRSIGGWPRLLSLTGEEFDKWGRNDFLKAYEAIDNVVTAHECRPLAGLETRQDREPVMIRCEYARTNQRLRRLLAECKVEVIQETRDGASTHTGGNDQRLLLRSVPKDERLSGYPGAPSDV